MKISNNYHTYPHISFSGKPYYKSHGETPVDLTEIIAREAQYAKMQALAEQVLSDEIQYDTFEEEGINYEAEGDDIRSFCETEHTIGEMLIAIQTQRLINNTPAPQPVMPKTVIETGRRRLDIKG